MTRDPYTPEDFRFGLVESRLGSTDPVTTGVTDRTGHDRVPEWTGIQSRSPGVVWGRKEVIKLFVNNSLILHVGRKTSDCRVVSSFVPGTEKRPRRTVSYLGCSFVCLMSDRS